MLTNVFCLFLNKKIKKFIKIQHHKKFSQTVVDIYFGNKVTIIKAKNMLMVTLFPKSVSETVKIYYL